MLRAAFCGGEKVFPNKCALIYLSLLQSKAIFKTNNLLQIFKAKEHMINCRFVVFVYCNNAESPIMFLVATIWVGLFFIQKELSNKFYPQISQAKKC